MLNGRSALDTKKKSRFERARSPDPVTEVSTAASFPDSACLVQGYFDVLEYWTPLRLTLILSSTRQLRYCSSSNASACFFAIFETVSSSTLGMNFRKTFSTYDVGMPSIKASLMPMFIRYTYSFFGS